MLRRVAFTAALAALLAPAGVAEAKKKTPKKPVVTSVKPMQANIGDTITIYGRNFIKGKAKNTIAFRKDGQKTVFVKGDVATLKQIRVVLPETLAPFLDKTGTTANFTRFRIRVLARRFGKSFTPLSKSPRIGPAPAKVADGTPGGGGTGTGTPGSPSAPAPTGNDDCDKDGVVNKNDADDDNDLLPDAQEAELMTDPCAKDSDADGMEDYFEFQSAIDLNDDEYQQPNTALPYPGKRPYPNPLDGGDAGKDYDGDALSGTEEHALWRYTIDTTKTATYGVGKLSYSAGLKYSAYGVCNVDDGNAAGVPCDDSGYDRNRRFPTLKTADYSKIWGGAQAGACPTTTKTDDPTVGFYAWLKRCGYEKIEMFWQPYAPQWDTPQADSYTFDIRDVNLTGKLSDGGLTTPDGLSHPDVEYAESPRSELYYYDLDKDKYLSDNERDEDADGLTNFDELHGRMLAEWWGACTGDVYGDYLPLDPFDADTDGDGVRDGADDEDRDDIPNIMELSRVAASGYDDTENGGAGWGIPGPAMSTCAKDKDVPKEGHHVLDGVREWGEVNPFNPCLPYYGSRTCPEAFPEAVPSWYNAPSWYSLN